jgi:hypothetical protein
MSLTPSSASKASASAQVWVPYKRAAALPSSACGIGASCAYEIDTSRTYVGASYADPSSSASRTDSSGTNASWCMTVGSEELKWTLVGSPVLIDDGNAMVRCGGVIGHVADQQMIGVAEVQLLPPRNHLLSSEMKTGEARTT